MQLHTLPKFFSKDHSPMSATDSPFPPLKTEHRYRGVYERAGFDVNLGGPSPDSASSRNSPNSPQFSPRPGKHSQGSIYSQSRNMSSGSMPRSAQGHKPYTPLSENNARRNFSDSRINQQHKERSSAPGTRFNAGVTGGTDPYAHLKQASDSSSNSSQSSASRPSRSGSASYTKRYEAESVNPRMARENEVDRNKKNLKLHIPEGKAQYVNSQETSGTSAPSSPFDTYRNERTSPSTSLGSHSDSQKEPPARDADTLRAYGPERASPASHTPYPVSGAEKDLNDVLASLKQDVADHRNYDPRGYSDKSSSHSVKSPVDSFVPATSNLHSTFHQQTERPEELSSQEDESSRLNSIRHSTESPETSTDNDDYNNFLRTSGDAKNSHHNPHLSTISSIISKPYDHESDEDDEIELELKRQLESIKAGSSISLDSKNVINSEDSFVTAYNVSASPTKEMPIFKVSPVEEAESEGSDTETEFEAEESKSPDVSDDEHSVSHHVPETPQFDRGNFDDGMTYETPETIKPLSPKNHQIERELENLNFYDEPRTIAQELSYTPQSEDEDDILRKNPTPSEFEAFPRSVINPKVPNFRTSEVLKNKAGTGPCRVCALPVVATSGPKKAIFSKTAELSGQWHRSCFRCSYAGCGIQFNKNVTSYVLLDNPFCNHHYHTLNDTLCQECHFGIEGECIENELKQKWHLQCLACTKCQRKISNDYFLIDGKIVCEEDSQAAIADLERSGLLTSDKVEKRRTRMLFID